LSRKYLKRFEEAEVKVALLILLVYTKDILKERVNIMRSTIAKWGNSQGVRLPKQLLDSVNLSSNDIVDIVAQDGNIVIKKAAGRKPYKTIQERFEGFEGEYQPISVNWGKPVGEEIW
jgi:antitoxin MazE